MYNTNNFIIRILDNDIHQGPIHDAYEKNTQGVTSYNLYEHLLCMNTYVSVNLSTKSFTEIIYKMLHRYFGEAKISSNGYAGIVSFKNVSVYIYSEYSKGQSMAQFKKELYKVINNIL